MESSQLVELITTLEQTTQMAKQFSTTTNPSHYHLIYSSLQSAHQSLSLFLSNRHNSIHLLTSAATNLPMSENSSCAVSHDDAEPMQVVEGEAEEEEHNSRTSIDKMEEKMKSFGIQNKRMKRPLSPSSAAVVEQRPRQSDENEFDRVLPGEFDPHGTMLRSLDLVYQFHG